MLSVACCQTPCCVRLVALEWERSPFALLIDAFRDPTSHVLVWTAVGAVALTAGTAGYLGAVRKLQASSRLREESSAKDHGLGRLQRRVLRRMVGFVEKAAPAATTALAFWLDALYISELRDNLDARVAPYATLLLLVLALGCTASLLLASSLVFWPLLTYADGAAILVDVREVRARPALWALVLLPACLASPSLLALLPWRVAEYGGFPTEGSMQTAYAITVSLSGAQLVLKATFFAQLSSAGSTLQFASVMLNLLLFLRFFVQRLLSFASQRSLRLRQVLHHSGGSPQGGSSPQSGSPEGKARRLQKGVSAFFSGSPGRPERHPRAPSDPDGLVISPVLLGKMALEEEERKAKKVAHKRHQKTGGLARLGLAIAHKEKFETLDEKVDTYLERTEQVEPGNRKPQKVARRAQPARVGCTDACASSHSATAEISMGSAELQLVNSVRIARNAPSKITPGNTQMTTAL